MSRRQLDYGAYTVGWVATLKCEVLAARLLLDEVHQDLPPCPHDPNSYFLGSIAQHNIVIVFPGAGITGISPATFIVTHMMRTFPKIWFGVLVGIGGGAPKAPNPGNADQDLRLGDVVVGVPDKSDGGVVHYDRGKAVTDGFEFVYHLNKPPPLLLERVQKLSTEYRRGGGHMEEYISKVQERAQEDRKLRGFLYPGRDHDKLFKASAVHVVGGTDCSRCDANALEHRLPREKRVVHYGLIGSGSQIMKSAERRNHLRDTRNILCFETEAAGVMDYIPCVVIRGISDYSDSHKADRWQPYAALTAAAYAKDLLRSTPVANAENTQGVAHLTPGFMTMLSRTDAGLSKVAAVHEDGEKGLLMDQPSRIQYEEQQGDLLDTNTQGNGTDTRGIELVMESLASAEGVELRRSDGDRTPVMTAAGQGNTTC